MNPNPAAPPAGAPLGGANAQDALNIPSILLIIAGALGALFALLGMVSAGTGSMNSMLQGDPQLARQLGPLLKASMGPMAVVLGLLRLAMSGVITFGAIKMRSLQGYGLSMAAAIISIIPCNACCCITLPVGIWALVILMKPEVKASFTS